MSRLNNLLRTIRINQGLSLYDMSRLFSVSEKELYVLEDKDLKLSQEILKVLSNKFMIDVSLLLNNKVNFGLAKFLYTKAFVKDGHIEIHDIYDAALEKGALLHRFSLQFGVNYSAIYVDDREFSSLERKWEPSLIVSWQGKFADSCLCKELND